MMCRAEWRDRGYAVVLAALLAGAPALSSAQSQSGRDPTLPPDSATRAPAADASGRPPAPDIGPVAVIVRDGRPYLVVGTRLYAQGQTLGDSRIERITETEVWLREGKTLHRKPIFSGIVRSASATTPVATAAKPECVVVAGKSRPAARPGRAPAARPRTESPSAGDPCRP